MAAIKLTRKQKKEVRTLIYTSLKALREHDTVNIGVVNGLSLAAAKYIGFFGGRLA